MFEKWKALDKSLEEKFANVSLSKKFPGYFNRLIFKSFAILMMLFVVATFWQQGWTLNAIQVSCPITSPGNCQNPVYDCTLPRSAELVSFCSKYEIAVKPQSWVCEVAPCDKPFLSPGESYSNAGWLIRHSFLILALLIILPFLLNGIIYRIKNGNWFYVRSE